MTLRIGALDFGKVREIDGASISIIAESLECFNESIEYTIEIGTYVNCGGSHGDTICMVSKIQIEEIEFRVPSNNGIEICTKEVKRVTLAIIGSITNSQFTRGTSRLPTINCSAFFLTSEQINSILGVGDNSDKKYFLVTDDTTNMAYLELDKLLGRHTAILGTTGSGKSCTVASIVQSILLDYPFPRIVFFDLHNEYPSAFGYGEDENVYLKEKTKCTSWENFSLPYWFLDLEEFLDIYYPGAGTNQIAEIKTKLLELKKKNIDLPDEVKERLSADSPIYFDIDDLIDWFKSEVDSASTSAKKEPFQKFLLKFEGIKNDSRYSFLNKGKDKKMNLCEYFDNLFGLNSNEKTYLNILDLSGLPSEVRNVCIGVLSRLCFDYKYWDLDPEHLPLALVLEEAHTYIPEESNTRFALCRERIERIAKEGRKYGISLIVVSQRPSNISSTVLSQCGTFITLRLTNDVDQNKVKRFLPDTLGGQANILPSLRDGEALVSGDGIKLPRRVKFKTPSPMPKSNDVRYHKSWQQAIIEGYSVENAVRGWQFREKGK